MFYGHIYTIVTVHSIKDCLDKPLHHSYAISPMTHNCCRPSASWVIVTVYGKLRL